VDNRTGFRRRGHAYHFEQARRALGAPSEIHHLADVPFPIIHAALGVAACGVAVALRPGLVGLRAATIGISILCLTTGLILVLYDRLVYPAGARPTVEGAALPVAGLGAFSLVLAGTVQIGPRLAAAAVTVAVIGGLPHLSGLRATGQEGWGTRFLRDAAGIAVLVPVLLAGATSDLPITVRLGVVAVGVGLVTLDGLLTEAMRRRQSAALALLVGAVVTGGVWLIDRVNLGTGAKAAVALLLWYGLRGIAGNVLLRPRRLLAVVEYAVVVGIALAALSWVAR
jgi:hypothetical protein